MTRSGSPSPSASTTRWNTRRRRPAPIRRKASSPACAEPKLVFIIISLGRTSPPTRRRWRGGKTTGVLAPASNSCWRRRLGPPGEPPMEGLLAALAIQPAWRSERCRWGRRTEIQNTGESFGLGALCGSSRSMGRRKRSASFRIPGPEPRRIRCVFWQAPHRQKCPRLDHHRHVVSCVSARAYD